MTNHDDTTSTKATKGITRFSSCLDHHIAQVQVADEPGRHEPGTGTIDYQSVFGALEDAKYRGWVGC